LSQTAILQNQGGISNARLWAALPSPRVISRRSHGVEDYGRSWTQSYCPTIRW
jgi:hypothetical protein